MDETRMEDVSFVITTLDALYRNADYTNGGQEYIYPSLKAEFGFVNHGGLNAPPKLVGE